MYLNTEDVSTTYEYTIDNGETFSTEPFYRELSGGPYLAYAKDDKGCISNTLVIELEPFTKIRFEFDYFFDRCQEGIGVININKESGCTNCRYSIDGGKSFQSSPTFANLKKQEYEILLKDESGCLSPKNNFLVQKVLTVTSSFTPISCYGEEDAKIELSIEGGTPPYSISWSYGQEMFKDAEEINGLAPGKYSAYISDYEKCDRYVEFEIQENPSSDVVANFALQSEKISSIDPIIRVQNLSSNSEQYFWVFPDKTSRLEDPKDVFISSVPGVYDITLFATDEYGCKDSLTKEIEIIDATQTTKLIGFTPNNDQLNDICNPVFNYPKNSKKCELVIRNYYNELIYEVADTGNCTWDGYIGGQIAEQGMYSYKLFIETPEHVSSYSGICSLIDNR